METIKITVPRPPQISASHEYITVEAVFCDDSCQVRFINAERKKLIRLNSELHTYLLSQFNKYCKNWRVAYRNPSLSPDLS